MARNTSRQPEMNRTPTREKDGRYHYYWYQEGKKRHVAASSQMDCVLAYYKKYQDIENGIVDVNPNTPVKVWAAQWLKTYKEPKGLTEKSLGMYREKLNGYILPSIGGRAIKTVTELHLQQILNDSSGMSKSHCVKLRLVLRELFGKAHDLGYIQRNPAAGLELPAMTVNQRRNLTPLEQEAFDQIIAEGKHRGCMIYQMMLYCGLRPGECAALRWKHILWGEKKVQVVQAKESGGHERIKEPKTHSGIRKIPIRPDYLKKLWAVRGFPEAPVFPRQDGKSYTDSDLYALWTRFKRKMDRKMAEIIVNRARETNDLNKAADILSNLSGDFSPYDLAREVISSDRPSDKIITYRNKLILHGESPELLKSLVAYDLRHTCCTNWIKAEIDLKTISYMMGHSDIKTTANVYSHTDAALVNMAAEKIDKYAGL